MRSHIYSLTYCVSSSHHVSPKTKDGYSDCFSVAKLQLIGSRVEDLSLKAHSRQVRKALELVAQRLLAV
jgi:hypothetical protein